MIVKGFEYFLWN